MPAWLRNARVQFWLSIMALAIAGYPATKGLDWLFGGKWWFYVAFGGFLVVWLTLWLRGRQA